jgi:TP901 family phage tail tape measure protein
VFNLAAQINLNLARGATANIRSQLQGITNGLSAKIDLEISPRAKSEIASLAQNMNALRTATRGLSGELASATSRVSQMATAYARVNPLAQASVASLTTSAGAARRASAAYAEASDTVTNFGRQVSLAGRRFVAFSVATGGMFAAVNALKAVGREAVQFDLAMNKLLQVSDDGQRGVSRLRAEIGRLSTTYGVASRDLAAGAEAFVQAGLNARQSAQAVETLALALSSPSFADARKTTEGMLAIFQQFGKDTEKLKDQLGSVNAVAATFATESQDLITAVQKSGGAFATAGGQLNELLALFTSIRATTRESADQIATGLRSIFTYVQRSDTIENLKQLGINLRYTKEEAKALGQEDLTDQFVGQFRAVQRLSEGLSKLRSTDPRYAQVVEDLGGIRQVSRVLPLIQQFGEAQKALNVARLGSASIEAAAAVRQDALLTKLTKIKETYQQLGNDLVQSSGFKKLADGLTTAATAAAELVKALGPLLPVVAALGIGRLMGGSMRFAAGVLTPELYGSSRAPTRRFAAGGPVHGGTPGVDSVPIMAQEGEYVLRKAAVDRLGRGRVEELNRTGRFPRYAFGGFVGRGVAAVGRKVGRTLGKRERVAELVSSLSLATGVGQDDLLEYVQRRQTERSQVAVVQGSPLGLKPQRKFAGGGQVRGGTRGVDSVEILAQDGEFVLNRNAVQGLGINRVRYMNRTGRLPRFADGGLISAGASGVVSEANINSILQEFQTKTGIDYKSLFKRLIVNHRGLDQETLALFNRSLAVQPGKVARGGYANKSGNLFLNQDRIKTADELREVLAHELGHAVDYKVGGGKAASLSDDSARQVAQANVVATREKMLKAGRILSEKESQYLYSDKEGFARAHADFLTGKGDNQIQAVLGRLASRARPKTRTALTNNQRDVFTQYLEKNPGLLERFAANLSRNHPTFGREDALGAVHDAARTVMVGYDPSKGNINALIFRAAQRKVKDELNKHYGAGRLGGKNLSRVSLTSAENNPDSHKRHAPAAAEEALQRLSADEVRRTEEEVARRKAKANEIRQAALKGTAAYTTGDTAGVQLGNPASLTAWLKARKAGGTGPATSGSQPPLPPPPPPAPPSPAGSPAPSNNDRPSYPLVHVPSLPPGYVHLSGGRGAVIPGYAEKEVERRFRREMRNLRDPVAGSPIGFRTDPWVESPSSPKTGLFPAPYGLMPAIGRGQSPTNRPGYRPGEPGPVGPTYGFGNAPGRPITPNAAASLLSVEGEPSPYRHRETQYRPGGSVAYNPLTVRDFLAGRLPAVAPPNGPGDGAVNTFRARLRLNDLLAGERFRDRPLSPTGLGFADIANARGATSLDAAQMHRLGGLAPAATANLAGREVSKAQNELAAGIRRQLQTLAPALKAQERLAIAEEMAAEAYRTNAQVIRNRNGKVVGLADLGQQITETTRRSWFSGTIDESGRGRFGRLADRLGQGGWLSRQAAGVVSVGSGALGRIRGSGGAGAAYAGMMAAPLIGQAFSPEDGAAARAVGNSGAESSFTNQTVTGGTLQYGAMGAGVGMVFGPWGAAIGGAIGAVYGFTTSLKDASKNLAEAKAANATEHLNENLRRVVEGKEGLMSANRYGIISDIREVRAAATTRAFENSSSFWRKTPDSDVLAKAQTLELRKALANQAGGFASILSSEATGLAKARPEARPEELVDELNKGVRGELLRVVADIRNVPLAKILNEMAQDVREAQRNFAGQKAVEDARVVSERQAHSAGRLVVAFDAVSASLNDFKTKLDLPMLAFGGHTPVGAPNYANNLGILGAPNPGGFREALGVVGGMLGPAGKGLVRSSQAADDIARILPSVLDQLVREGNSTEHTTHTRVEKGLRESLLPEMSDEAREKALKENPELRLAIANVSSQVRKLDQQHGGNALPYIGHDTQGAAKNLNVDNAKAAAYSQEIARRIQEANLAYATGLSTVRQNASTVGSEQDRLAEARLGLTRALAVSRSERLGGGDASRFLSLEDLTAPHEARQSRLLAGTGLRNEDVSGISSLLEKERQSLDSIKTNKDKAEGNPERFAQLSREFEATVQRTQNLQEALRNLADAGKRGAAIQERLNTINSDRDNRLSFAEKFIMASPEERQKMRRGQTLAAQVAQDPELFKRMSEENKRLFIQASHDIGPSQFKNGFTGDSLRNFVLEDTGIVPPEMRRGRQKLTDENARVAGVSVRAQGGIAADLVKANDWVKKFVQGARDTVVSGLATQSVYEQRRQTQSMISSQALEKNRLNEQVNLRKVLGAVGIEGTDASVKEAQRYFPDLKKYFEKLDEVNAPGEDREKARGYLQRSAGGNETDLLHASREERRLIFSRILDSSKIGKDLLPEYKSNAIDEAANGSLFMDINEKLGHRSKELGRSLTPEERQDTMNDVAAERLHGAVFRRVDTVKGWARDEMDKAAGELRLGKISPEGLAGINREDRAKLMSALDPEKKSESIQGLDKLDENLRNVNKELAALGTMLSDLNKQLPAQPQHRAQGGLINWSPRGSDVVPAMLSPNEYIINAKSSVANRPLLHAINNARGPLDDSRFVADGDDRKRRIIRGAMGTYETIRQGMVSAADWLGLARGGVVPQYLAAGGVARKLTKEDEARARDMERAQRGAAAEGATNPFDTFFLGGWNHKQADKIEGDIARYKEALKKSKTPAEERLYREAIKDARTKFAESNKKAIFETSYNPNGEAGLDRMHHQLEKQGRALIAKGKLKAEDLGLYMARNLAQVNARRQVGSLLEQQAYAGAGGLPGEDEVYGGVVARLQHREAEDQALFMQKFGRGFWDVHRDVAHRMAERADQRAADVAWKKAQRAALKRPTKGKLPIAPAPRPKNNPPLDRHFLVSAPTEPIHRFAAGGLVTSGSPNYDSTLAMLEKGEGVVSRAGMQSLGASGLASLNRGGSPGGSDGSSRASDAAAKMGESAARFNEGMSGFNNSVTTMNSGFSRFESTVDKLVTSLDKIPTHIEYSGQIDVNLVGGAVAQPGVSDAVKAEINRQIRSMMGGEFNRRMPEATAPLASDSGSLR